MRRPSPQTMAGMPSALEVLRRDFIDGRDKLKKALSLKDFRRPGTVTGPFTISNRSMNTQGSATSPSSPGGDMSPKSCGATTTTTTATLEMNLRRREAELALHSDMVEALQGSFKVCV